MKKIVKANHKRYWGPVLRKLRRQRTPKISGASVARRLGVDRTSITYWETGRNVIDEDELMEWLSYLEIPFLVFAHEVQNEIEKNK